MTTYTLAPSSGADRAEQALPLALELIDAVRRKDRTDIQACIDSADLPALTVILAALVDDSRPVRELLAWVETPPRRQPGERRNLRPCGTHAAYERHRNRGEEPCALCRRSEREYQRNRPDRAPGVRVA